MKIKEYKSYTELCKEVFDFIKEDSKEKSHYVLGLATGSTPLGVYKCMSNDTWDSKKVMTFNLDTLWKKIYLHINNLKEVIFQVKLTTETMML